MKKPVLFIPIVALVMMASLQSQAQPGPLEAGEKIVEKHQRLLTFMHNAGWCWFQEPSAIIRNDMLLIGGVTGNCTGEAVVGIYDIEKEIIANRAVVAPRFDDDDHNSPPFYARADGSALTVYARHSTENKHY